MPINKMKIPEDQTLAGNKELLLSLLKHPESEGTKSPDSAKSTAQTLLLEFIGDKEILSVYWDVLDKLET